MRRTVPWQLGLGSTTHLSAPALPLEFRALPVTAATARRFGGIAPRVRWSPATGAEPASRTELRAASPPVRGYRAQPGAPSPSPSPGS